MRVGEAIHRDVGKRRARIGPDAMDFLGVSPGDIVKMSGPKSSCAIVWPADEDEKDPEIIRIDGQTRKSMGVSLNDGISVAKASAKPAHSAVLVPVNDAVTIDSEFTGLCKGQTGRPPPDEG